MSSTSSFSVTSSGFRREGKKDTPGRKQITPVWALNTCHVRKHICTEKRKKTEVCCEFPQSFLILCSTLSTLLHLSCLLITSRVELSLPIASHLSPMCVWACLHACLLASKCVKVCTRDAPASPLATIPPKVKGHMSWQLPGWIRCDNFPPPAALPSSLLLFLLLLSPAGLHWAHTHFNVGQCPLTQGSGYVLFLC